MPLAVFHSAARMRVQNLTIEPRTTYPISVCFNGLESVLCIAIAGSSYGVIQFCRDVYIICRPVLFLTFPAEWNEPLYEITLLHAFHTHFYYYR